MKHNISSTRCIRSWTSASYPQNVRPFPSLKKNPISLRNVETLLLPHAQFLSPCDKHHRAITTTQPRSLSVLEAPIIPPETALPVALLADAYPNAPEVLFTKPWSYEGWRVVLPKRKPRLTISSKTEVNSDGLPEHHVNCVYTLKVPGGNKYQVEHRAPTKIEAIQFASSQLILALHRDGALQQIIDRRQEIALLAEQEDDDELPFEHNAETEARTFVYEYCASFFSYPEVKFDWGQPDGQFVKVEIVAPKMKIHITESGKLFPAMMEALRLFKTTTDEYPRANVGETPSSRKTPTVDNCLPFIRFFCRGQGRGQRRRSTEFEQPKWAQENAHSYESAHVEAQFAIAGRPVGKAVISTQKGHAQRLAQLTAAVQFATENPKMWEEFIAIPEEKWQSLQDYTPKSNIQKGEDKGNFQTENVLEKEKEEVGEAGKEQESGVYPLKLTTTTEMISLMSSVSHDILQTPVDSTNDPALPDTEVYRQPMYRWKVSKEKLEARSRQLLEHHKALQSNPSLASLRKQRRALPMSKVRDKVLDMINQNPFSIVVGSTGSGKTTQVPQLILEDAILRGEGSTAEIVCTQPRRIAARSAAKRVAVERDEMLRDTVGYHVKDDAKLPISSGGITFCTAGILLQRLRFNPDHTMDTLSHIIIDEVHERDMLVDFLMIALKDNVQARLKAGKRVPKVVVMSATLDMELFSNYFSQEAGDGSKVQCPSIVIPGRTFPVSEVYLDDIVTSIKSHQNGYYFESMLEDVPVARFLEDEGLLSIESLPYHMRKKLRPDEYQLGAKKEAGKNSSAPILGIINEALKGQLSLIAATIAHIAKTTTTGAILVFLPGMGEITDVHKILHQNPLGVNFGDPAQYTIIILHSALPDSQDNVFDETPKGCRKIILATNVAETSITIPDVKYVIDSGKSREPAYDQLTGITRMAADWVNKPSTKQRAGRAGRVSNGHYFAVFSKKRQESLRASILPEILRSDLQQICLNIKTQSFTDSTDIGEVLSKAIEPPNPDAVKAAIQDLQDLEAVTEHEGITPLGRFLSCLPIHPAMGKIVVRGIMFRCFDAMLLHAAANQQQLTVRPPWSEKEADASKFQFANGTNSDPVALMNQFRWARSQQGQEDFRDLMREKFLSPRVFHSIDRTMIEVEDILVEAGIIPNTLDEERVQYQCGHPVLNRNSNNLSLIKALMLAANRKRLAVRKSSPAKAQQKARGQERSYDWIAMDIGHDETPVKLHPSSINAVRKLPPGRRDLRTATLSSVYSYGAGVRGMDNMLLLRDVSQSSPLTAALFGCKVVSSFADEANPQLIVDDWLPIDIDAPEKAEAITAILKFREAADRIQAATFSSILNRPNHDEDSGGLADELLMEKFVDALINVLELDPRDQTVHPLLMEENLLSAMDLHIIQDMESKGLGGG